jgi:uncharacterized membrane protein YhaH (DUF805 family)
LVLYSYKLFDILFTNICDYRNRRFLSKNTFLEIFGLAAALFYLSTIIPTLEAISRRLHDTNKSGAYIFMYLIPIAGPIILLVALFTDGDRFPNNYGPDPKNPGLPQFDFENYKES